MSQEMNRRMKKYEMITSCAAGLEELVEVEIKQFGGMHVACSKGMVSWQGDLESAYRCCLWSRFASRVRRCRLSWLYESEFRCGESDRIPRLV